MPEPLVVRKEVIVREDGRQVILYTFVRANEAEQSPQPSQAAHA